MKQLCLSVTFCDSDKASCAAEELQKAMEELVASAETGITAYQIQLDDAEQPMKEGIENV